MVISRLKILFTYSSRSRWCGLLAWLAACPTPRAELALFIILKRESYCLRFQKLVLAVQCAVLACSSSQVTHSTTKSSAEKYLVCKQSIVVTVLILFKVGIHQKWSLNLALIKKYLPSKYFYCFSSLRAV